MNKMWKIVVTLVVLAFANNAAFARKTSPLALGKKVEASDAVFIGRIVSIEDPGSDVPGVERYATVQVEQVLLGSDVPATVQFVTRGFSEELNPLCCRKKARYLFFAQRGFDLFDFNSDGAVVVRSGKERFYSAVNGPYSTYLIRRGCVAGWPDQVGRSCAASIQEVIEEVATRTAVRRVNP